MLSWVRHSLRYHSWYQRVPKTCLCTRSEKESWSFRLWFLFLCVGLCVCGGDFIFVITQLHNNNADSMPTFYGICSPLRRISGQMLVRRCIGALRLGGGHGDSSLRWVVYSECPEGTEWVMNVCVIDYQCVLVVQWYWMTCSAWVWVKRSVRLWLTAGLFVTLRLLPFGPVIHSVRCARYV